MYSISSNKNKAIHPIIANCHHCQESCEDDTVKAETGEVFCCQGCKTVYGILAANDLCYFYDLDENAGISFKKMDKKSSYAWLDDAEISDKLLLFKGEKTHIVAFYLPQIHCASCIWLLENLHKLDVGVQSGRVNFLKKEITIKFDPTQTSLRRVVALLATLGYAPEIHLSDVDDKEKSDIDRSIFYKIGVAGFVFGNTMLLSFPEYLGLDILREAWFARVFGYTNLILSLPVMLYSGFGYFRSAWKGLRLKQLNLDVPLAIGILALFIRSAYEILTTSGAGYLDSMAGLVFFLLIGKWFQQKTFNHLSFERDYKSYFPVAASVRMGEEIQSTPVHKLKIGDLIEVCYGELIPADGILIKGTAEIDYSFVTGEADPTRALSGDKVFAGGRQMGEILEISLTKPVDQSYLTQLWNNANYEHKGESDGQLLADRLGKWFTYLVLSVSAATLLFWLVQGQIPTAINAFTAVLIIACPCAVALSIPFTFGNILQLLGRQGFYLKNTKAIEMLAKADAAVFDKTGTLTARPEAVAVTTSNEHITSMQTFTGTAGAWEKMAVRSLCRQSIHPKSRQIFDLLAGVPFGEVIGFQEFTGRGIQGIVDEKKVQIGSAAWLGLGRGDMNKNQPFNMNSSGVFVKIEEILIGQFDFSTALRNDLSEVLSVFEAKGDTYLLSGDNERDTTIFKPFFPEKEQMHFNQSPQDKLDFIKKLQKTGKSVLMVGDGLNDAGALKQSNMGIAVSEKFNNFTPACDGILQSSAFGKLPDFLTLTVFANTTVKRAIGFAALYNIVGLSYAVTGTLSPVVAAILMPLSSVSIVGFCVGSTYWKAWKLGLLTDKTEV